MNPNISIETLRDRLQSYRPSRIQDPTRISAAVLIPLLEREGQLHLLFTKRTNHVQHHRGEICFPGGSREEQDADLLATSLRELREEIAVQEKHVEILGCLDELRTVASNFLVVPFVGLIHPSATFQKSEFEVEEILVVPLAHFGDPAIFSQGQRVVDQQEYTVYYYQWKNHTIWGVTGRILKSFLNLLS